jgi:hypothetical protein
MSENKREKMRAIKQEMDHLIKNSPVAVTAVLSTAAMRECLRLNWAQQDGAANFVPTELGKAMMGRKEDGS